MTSNPGYNPDDVLTAVSIVEAEMTEDHHATIDALLSGTDTRAIAVATAAVAGVLGIYIDQHTHPGQTREILQALRIGAVAGAAAESDGTT